ncbi:MAG: excinuclease ABC subunit UvrA, partial [Acholeplasmataceae bacterium]|nr:excinuclease ABC subunit UvrA [Acholeplasmataceae bacterium]
MKNDVIKIYGARENNLKNIDITLPKNSLIVMTGISGSGKSSLAFDTLYQEGRRRYVESLSAYARQFLGSFEKPKVDRIDGLSPSISIDQKSTSNNPRSTVGTITEIYDYFRLLYSKIGTPYNPFTGEALKKHTILEMTDTILNFKEGTKFVIIAPIIKNQAGNHKKVLEKYLKDGFSRVMINGNEYYLEELPKMDLKTTYSIGIIVDRLIN